MVKGSALVGKRSRTRFVGEVQVLAKLKHPNVVALFHFDEHDGTPYFSMEYLEAGSLERAIETAPPKSPREAARTIQILAETMADIHRLGIIHRDLKPSNILLAKQNNIKALQCSRSPDFGLAKRLASGFPNSRPEPSGTRSYMSPEQHPGDGEIPR